MKDADACKVFFLSQTCSRHGMSIQSRAQHYTSMSHAHNKWETRGTGTHGHFSPSPLEVAHCVQQLLAVIAIGIGLSHRLSQAAYKKIPLSESHELSTAKAWRRCLTPSLATGQRPLASAHSNTRQLQNTFVLRKWRNNFRGMISTTPFVTQMNRHTLISVRLARPVISSMKVHPHQMMLQ